jgi:hypothetical protein
MAPISTSIPKGYLDGPLAVCFGTDDRVAPVATQPHVQQFHIRIKSHRLASMLRAGAACLSRECPFGLISASGFCTMFDKIAAEWTASPRPVRSSDSQTYDSKARANTSALGEVALRAVDDIRRRSFAPPASRYVSASPSSTQQLRLRLTVNDSYVAVSSLNILGVFPQPHSPVADEVAFC